jgi:hypothetical protein
VLLVAAVTSLNFLKRQEVVRTERPSEFRPASEVTELAS